MAAAAARDRRAAGDLGAVREGQRRQLARCSPPRVDVLRALIDDRGTLWHNLKPTAVEIVLGLLLGVGAGAAASPWRCISRGSSARRSTRCWSPRRRSRSRSSRRCWCSGSASGCCRSSSWSRSSASSRSSSPRSPALEAVDPDLIKLLATFDAGRLQTFWRVELPSALPGLFAGAKLAAVFSVLAAILGRAGGCKFGTWVPPDRNRIKFELAEAFATVFVLSAFAILLFALLTLAERRALPWAYRLRETEAR